MSAHTARFAIVLGCALLAQSARAEGARTPDESTRPDEWTPLDEEARDPHHVRSLWQMGAGLALGTGGYWLLLNRNIVDWDDPQIRRRFDGSAWVLDNNNLAVNFLGHPGTGGLSYSFARANHQSMLGSFGYAFLTSFLWEFAIEFKEKVSVNDTIVTPGAAVPIGEFFYKLGLYLDTGQRESTWASIGRWLLGTGVALDRRLDRRPAPRVKSFDNLGFSASIWHEFAVDYGVVAVRAPGAQAYGRGHAGVAARLVTLPGYRKASSFGRGFWGAELSELAIGLEASRHGAGLLVEGDTVVAGYHAQRMAGAGERAQGELVTLGTSMSFDYLYSAANRSGVVERAMALPESSAKYHVPRRREQFASFGLPGLAADALVQKSWGKLQLSGRLQPSFAGLSAAAFYEWTAANRDARSKHVLHHQGYFYGWGGVARLKGRFELGALRVTGALTYGAYSSQNGLDRHRVQVTDDTPVTGDVLRYGWSVGVAPGPGVTLAVDWGVRRFRSAVRGFEATVRAEELGVRAGWAF